MMAPTSQFTGKERDVETGLDYFLARYYSGAQGRFASPDPKHFSQRTLINPQKWNQYTYVINNPLVRFDPDGKDEHHIVVKAVFDKLKSSLLPEVYKSFDSATIYAGNQGMHHFWREHREYNALVKSLWDGFFDGIEPEKITKDMASDSISGLKQNPRIQKLNAQILIKGGVSPSAFPGWISATTIDDAALLASRSWAKYLKTMGLFLSVGAFILTEPREASRGR